MLTEMLLLGLLGSTHCLAMCGGFMLAVRGRAASYQAGRLLGYSLAGAALASAGWAARLGLGNRLFPRGLVFSNDFVWIFSEGQRQNC